MRGNNNNRVTMRDVAKEAGVTITTVSRVLGGPSKHSESTRQKVIETAERLKYRPNALVRGMQTGKTGTIGVMLSSYSGFQQMVIAGIHDELATHNNIMLLGWNGHSLNDHADKREKEIIFQLVDRQVEGVILRPSSEEFEKSYFEEIISRDIPLIVVDRELDHLETDFVGSDNALAGQLAAEHLLELGHRQLLYLGVGDQVKTNRERQASFIQHIEQYEGATCASLQIDPQFKGFSQNDDKKYARFKSELNKQLERPNRPTAIFCFNDHLANEIGPLIEASGLSIPKDISLMGCGNIPDTNPYPLLTTMEQHPTSIGQIAAQLCLDRANGGKEAPLQRRIIAPELIVRKSTGPCPPE